MLQGLWRLKAQVKTYIDAKRSLKTCFSKKNPKNHFCKKSWRCNHNNRTLFIIIHRWIFDTNCDHIAYAVFGSIYNHSMFFLCHKKRDQQVWIRSITMEHFRSKIEDELTFEENFHPWRFFLSRHRPEIFSNSKIRRILQSDQWDTNTQQNATEVRVLYMFFIA